MSYCHIKQRYGAVQDRLPHDAEPVELPPHHVIAAPPNGAEDPFRDWSQCGAWLSFEGTGGPAVGAFALLAAMAVLRDGGVLAVKGVSGYHLMCDAAEHDAVVQLRIRKHRPTKPFAVMFPQTGEDGLRSLRAHTLFSDEEADAVRDPRRPIVLVRRLPQSRLSPAVAPGLNELGVMLPISPLHDRLIGAFARPLVATSGNLAGTPIQTDDAAAKQRLAGAVDGFLIHNLPIAFPAEDTVLRVIAGRPRPLRLGRGFAPLEIDLPAPLRHPTLSIGTRMQGSIALGYGQRALISPHIGGIDSPEGQIAMEQAIADLRARTGTMPTSILCGGQPDDIITQWAQRQTLPCQSIQHHRGHASALAGEHPEIKRWLMLVWDGTWPGDDRTLWGGEALLGAPGKWRRVGRWRPFQLPGRAEAEREPWRSAAALTWELGIDYAADQSSVYSIWRRGMATTGTSSVARLFDAATALTMGIPRVSYEGEAAMRLEAVAEPEATPIMVPITKVAGLLELDWAPVLSMLTNPSRQPARRAGIFHATMAHAAADLVSALQADNAFDAVGLTGGVFQNRLLTETLMALLAQRNMVAVFPSLMPVNDGALAFGQLIEALGTQMAAV